MSVSSWPKSGVRLLRVSDVDNELLTSILMTCSCMLIFNDGIFEGFLFFFNLAKNSRGTLLS